MNKIRIIGLALVAVLAVSAVSVASASAKEFKLTSYPGMVAGVGTENQVFTVTGGEVVCETSSFESGTISANSETLEMSATYSKCKAFSGKTSLGEASVAMEGCKYKFHTNETTDVICEGTKAITITIVGGICVIKVAAQTGLSKVGYELVSGEAIVTPNVAKITYTVSGALCPLSSGTAGTYKGKAKAKGLTTGGGSDPITEV
jgi:hypothetical protein